MPIEIREITIRTDVTSGANRLSNGAREKELSTLRKHLLEECRRIITLSAKKAGTKR
ncbi:MAG TPA: DUF5908 family protein [Bacteroidia bacterium]|nr:DUF5908 family protein [Bacteroidia bacterium]